jgi:hypothetical protein
MDDDVQVMVAHVNLPDGQTVARIERVTIGGGTRVIEGEEHVHPMFEAFHVRLLSPNPMIPDEMHDATTYDEAVAFGRAYAAKRAEHAAAIADLADSLKM